VAAFILYMTRKIRDFRPIPGHNVENDTRLHTWSSKVEH